MAYRTTPVDTDRMPPGIPYIIGNEAAERFSFYGMRAILMAFMTTHLMSSEGVADLMSDAEASKVQHLFLFGAYFTPLLGAFLADGLFGKYPVIIALSLFYCLGHGVLAFMDAPELIGLEPRTLLYLGLLLIAIGAGGVKPCVSSHVGDQFGRRNAHLLERVYGWFYISINVGAAISQLLTPWLLANEDYGPTWAFGLPGVLMLIATIVFWMGRKQFAHVPPTKDGFFSQLASATNRRIILRLVPLYIFITAFWMLFDQTSTRWVAQAQDMDNEFNLGFTSFKLLPSQMQFINPTFILIFVPLLTVLVYPGLSRVFKLTPLRKIGVGLSLTGVSFLITGWAQTRIDAGETPHIAWQILAYAVLTLAEVLVSITSLEFSYTQAPKSLKSVIMGVYFLSVAFANLFVAEVNHYIEAQEAAGAAVLPGASYYWFFAAIVGVASLAFIVWSQFYKYEMIVQDAGEVIPLDAGRDGAAVADGEQPAVESGVDET